MKRISILFAALAACFACSVAQADAWPSKTITIVVPYAAGGGVDFVARLVGTELSKRLGQAVVIENRPGAGGTIGAAYVAHSDADGYTLLVGGTGPLSVAPAIYKHLSYSPLKDLVPVSLLVLIPQILVANPKFPAHSVSDVIALAKAKPGTIRIASGGIGTGQDLAATLLMRTALVKMISVPYKGTSLAVNDLLGGHVDMMFADPSIVPMVRAGQLLALGVTTPKRSTAMPNVPTVAESGKLPTYGFTSFYALSAPAATPGPVVKRLNDAIAAVLADPVISKKLIDEGMEPDYTSTDAARAFITEHSKSAISLITDAAK